MILRRYSWLAAAVSFLSTAVARRYPAPSSTTSVTTTTPTTTTPTTTTNLLLLPPANENNFHDKRLPFLSRRYTAALLSPAVPKVPRGGGDEKSTLANCEDSPNIIKERRQQQKQEEEGGEEEERYSRQVYTLGKRAHGLIRSSTVYLNGPPTSGLMYEVAKNLALSGIHRIILVVDDQNFAVAHYHNAALDDLGQSYSRAARQETRQASPIVPLSDSDHGNDMDDDDGDVFLEYVKRLNPSVQVARCGSKQILETTAAAEEDTGPVVYIAIDRPLSYCQDLNEWIRKEYEKVKFVAVDTAGVYAHVFVDLGDEFVIYNADGETPLLTPLLQVLPDDSDVATSGNSSCPTSFAVAVAVVRAKIHCMPGEKHDVSKGDVLQFHLRNGQIMNNGDLVCTVEKVESPYLVHVKFDFFAMPPSRLLEHLSSQAVAFSRVQQLQTVHFNSLANVIATIQANPDSHGLVTPSDLDKSFNTQRQQTLLRCFESLYRFVQAHGQLSKGQQDVEAAVNSLMRTTADQYDDHDDSNQRLIVSSFVRNAAAKFVPLQGVMGAIAAQEALKAVSGLYTPVRQFLFLDCEEVLQPHRKSGKEGPMPERTTSLEAPGLRYILGDDVVNELQSQRIFVVGAGAIGCELLKNLVSMGIACGKPGKIILTDMDTIEKSNLSRQLLFRDHDLGEFKSVAAERAALLFNPKTQIEAHSSKVGGDESTVFSQEVFWSDQVDVVLNALDNVDARLYMDGQCVKWHKPLVDAGTMGPKGNVQVVVPWHQTESYASSADPPEEAIPVCTLKNFPYAISHTIQWARDLFDGLYVQRPRQANDLVSELQSFSEESHAVALSRLAHKLEHEAGQEAALISARNVAEDLLALENSNVQHIRSKALEWAVKLAHKLYVESVDDLLKQHPLDSLEEDGQVFWSGTRRPPCKLLYTAKAQTAEQKEANQNLISFVQHGARLRAESFLSMTKDALFSVDEVIAALETFLPPEEVGRKDENQEESVLGHLSRIPVHIVEAPVQLNLADFEKDDDSNGHVTFITAASNLRAMSYGIPPVDAMETRRVAGRIIPAMISTTALVSALSCIELVKLVQKAPLNQHRNGFCNLALNFFAFTAPLPADTTPGLNGREYTLWDRLSISESRKVAENGGLTVKSLLKKIQKMASDDPETVQVASISLGPYLLYANFLHEDDKDILKLSIWDVIREMLQAGEDEEEEFFARDGEPSSGVTHFSPEDKTFDLSVVVEDLKTGQEAELPPICLRRFSNE